MGSWRPSRPHLQALLEVTPWEDRCPSLRGGACSAVTPQGQGRSGGGGRSLETPSPSQSVSTAAQGPSPGTPLLEPAGPGPVGGPGPLTVLAIPPGAPLPPRLTRLSYAWHLACVHPRLRPSPVRGPGCGRRDRPGEGHGQWFSSSGGLESGQGRARRQPQVRTVTRRGEGGRGGGPGGDSQGRSSVRGLAGAGGCRAGDGVCPHSTTWLQLKGQA